MLIELSEQLSENKSRRIMVSLLQVQAIIEEKGFAIVFVGNVGYFTTSQYDELHQKLVKLRAIASGDKEIRTAPGFSG